MGSTILYLVGLLVVIRGEEVGFALLIYLKLRIKVCMEESKLFHSMFIGWLYKAAQIFLVLGRFSSCFA